MTATKGQEREPSALLWLATTLELPVRLAGVVSSLLILLSLTLMLVAIFQRYFFNTPLKWGDELLGYLLVATIMCGAAEALRRGDHVAIDLLSVQLGKALEKSSKILAHLAVLAFAVIFGLSSDEVVRFSYSFGSYSPGYLEAPMWIPQSPMTLGAVLLGLGAVAGLIRTHIRTES